MTDLDAWEFTITKTERDGATIYHVTGRRKDARQYDGSPSLDGYGFVWHGTPVAPVTGEADTPERAYSIAAYRAGASDGRSDEIMVRAQRAMYGGRW